MTRALISKGEEKLNIGLDAAQFIFVESRGDYWLTQALCQTICMRNDVLEAVDERRDLVYEPADIRANNVSAASIDIAALVRIAACIQLGFPAKRGSLSPSQNRNN